MAKRKNSVEQMLGTKEAAAELSVHQSLVARWCARQQIHAIKIGKTWAIPRSELDRFKEQPRYAGWWGHMANRNNWVYEKHE